MRKRKQRFTLYRLPGDPLHCVRRLAVVRRKPALAYLVRTYGAEGFTLLEPTGKP